MPRQLRASRILLADDNADLRSYVAGSATIMMPVMDGFALARATRRPAPVLAPALAPALAPVLA